MKTTSHNLVRNNIWVSFFAFVTVARGTRYASYIGISTGWKENFSLIKRWFFCNNEYFYDLIPFFEFPSSAIQRREQKRLIETHRSVSELIMQTEIAMSGWRFPFLLLSHSCFERQKSLSFYKTICHFLIAILIFNLFTTRGSSWVDKRKRGGGGKKGRKNEC